MTSQQPDSSRGNPQFCHQNGANVSILGAALWFSKPRRMLEHGILPNVISYSMQLKACAQRGDMAEAEEWLLEMWRLASWTWSC